MHDFFFDVACTRCYTVCVRFWVLLPLAGLRRLRKHLPLVDWVLTWVAARGKLALYYCIRTVIHAIVSQLQHDPVESIVYINTTDDGCSCCRLTEDLYAFDAQSGQQANRDTGVAVLLFLLSSAQSSELVCYELRVRWAFKTRDIFAPQRVPGL